MLDKILNIFRKTRVEKILESCGCVCYCPECKEPLNDNSECKKLSNEGLYLYTCNRCGYKPAFHYGIAPVPIYLKEESINVGQRHTEEAS